MRNLPILALILGSLRSLLAQEMDSQWTSDSRYLAVAREQNIIFLEPGTRTKRTRQADEFVVNDLFISRDHTIYSCGLEGVVRKWTTGGQLLQSFGKTAYSLNALTLDENNQLLIAGDAAGYLYIWDERTGELVTDVKVHSAGITALTMADGALYSTGFDGRIYKTDPRTWKPELIHTIKEGNVYDLQQAGAGILIFSAQQQERKGKIQFIGGFNLKKKKAAKQLLTDFNYATAFSLGLDRYGNSPDRFTLNGSAVVYRIENDRVVKEPLAVDAGVYSNCNYSPDLKWSGGDDAVVGITPATDGTEPSLETWSYTSENEPSEDIPVVPALEKPMTSLYPSAIKAKIAELRKQKGPMDSNIVPVIQNGFLKAYHAVISPDSAWLAVSNESEVIKIFDLRQKKLVANLMAGSPVIRMDVHPFAPLFATLQVNGKLKVWDFESLNALKEFDFINLERFNKTNEGERERLALGPLFDRRISFQSNNQHQLLFFSEIGDELAVYDPDTEPELINFNRFNLFDGPAPSPLNEFSPVGDGKYELMGYPSKFFSIEIPITGRRYAERYNSYLTDDYKTVTFLGSPVAAARYGSLNAAMKYVVPAVHTSDNGFELVYDNGSSLHAIDLRTLKNNTINLNSLPKSFGKFVSRTTLDPDDLKVPKTGKHMKFFMIRQYIDTTYAKAVKVDQRQYEREFKVPGLNTGFNRFYHMNCCDNVMPLFTQTQFQWSSRSNRLEQLTEQVYSDSIDLVNSDSLEMNTNSEGEKEIWPDGPDTFSEYYVQEGELMAREKDQFRFNFNFTADSYQHGCYSTVIPTGEIRIRETVSKKLIGTTPPQSSGVIYQEFLDGSGFFLTNNLNGEIKLWDWRKPDIKDPVVTFIGSKDELFAMTPDFYYAALTPKANNIAFRKNGILFGFEQFDLKYNRPDIVLKRIGHADTTLIRAYRQAYLKRLKKMGFTEDMLRDDFHLPGIRIENFENLPAQTDSASIGLELNLKDLRYKLDRVNVWVNDVAVFGTAGIPLRELNKNDHRMKVTVPLAMGTNKIQVSLLNQAGAESYKESVTIEGRTGKAKPDLYLITLGGGRFKDQRYDLTYAAKDARDIADMFTEGNVYGKVVTTSLIDQELTREHLPALRSFLSQAGINDQVMIFFAGHGVLDKQLDYYFATHDMDFNDPAKRGIAYEDLEGLLDGIAPLKKVLMIDACHSGELDKDEVKVMKQSANRTAGIQFRAVGGEVKPKLGMENTSELTRSLFSDLRKGTGATIISSAGGMEFAMEGKDWNNGLFTHCLLTGLMSGQADLNTDGEIWLSELKQYVAEQVAQLSGGKQQPTSRMENQTMDIRVK